MTMRILFIAAFTIVFVGATWLLRNYQSPRATDEDGALLDVKDCEEDHEVVRVSSQDLQPG